MSLDKVSAERDALVQALKRAEEEIARSRAGQQKAEAKLAEALTGRMPMVTPVRNDGSHPAVAQAQAAQKRAETTVQTLEEQVRRQNAELTDLRAAFEGLKKENDHLHDHGEGQKHSEKHAPQKAAPSPAQPSRNEVKSLRDELDKAWAEIHRLRALVVKVASEARKGIVPEEPFPDAPSRPAPSGARTAPRSATPVRPAPSTPPARPQSSVNCVPKSGARRAA